MKGFTLIEMLVVIMIVGVGLAVSIINVNAYFEGLRLKTATADLIQDLQWAEETAKGGTQTFVGFGRTAPDGTYTGTYTVLVGENAFENPIWLSNTEKKRDMSKFHLMPNLPVGTPSFSFATVTGFVEVPIEISLSSKKRSRYVTISRIGKVQRR